MGKIKVTPCEIEGLYVIEPTVFKDERGYFVETYNQNDFQRSRAEYGICPGQPVHVCEGCVKRTSLSETFPHRGN